MATITPQALQCSNPITFFFSSSSSSSFKLHAPPRSHSYIPRATASDDDDEPNKPQTESSTTTGTASSDADSFESKLAQIRLRNKSGTGKKAERRKTKTGKKGASNSGAGLYLPPVALTEPVSEGIKVEFGFSPYSERVNGRLALLGLTALILVELYTGKSVIKYHPPSVVLIQVYFMAAASALFLKFEKEKLSVWPQSSDK